ncbi:hypothetical protein [Silvimonas iriomotensis]|nr:hypothetical protein [Silvimonas iriomotensis]
MATSLLKLQHPPRAGPRAPGQIRQWYYENGGQVSLAAVVKTVREYRTDTSRVCTR